MPRTVFWLLLGGNALLVVLHLFSPWQASPADRLNMDAEVSIATWFTEILLFSCAALAGSLWNRERREAWLGMALVLLYLSLDEAAALHELVAAPVREYLRITGGPWVFAWTIPALIIVGVVVAVFLPFFLRLPRRTQLLFAAAAGTYVLGAVGIEIASGLYWTEQEFQFDNTYRAFNAVEEGLENLGVIIGITALLDYRARRR